MKAISVEDLSFAYPNHKVLEHLFLELLEGEAGTILGDNGSGKSTFLKLLIGELKPQKGTIEIFGKNLEKMTHFQEIGYVPQLQTSNQISFPVTPLELVVLNLYHTFKGFKIPRKAHKEKARQALVDMGLGAYVETPMNELSGGLRQRVMIARAVINNPKILILDEPTAGVDKESKIHFFEILKRMQKERKMTILMVTHESELARQYMAIDKVYKMEEGRLFHAGI